MKTRLLLLLAILPLAGCNVVRKAFPQYNNDSPAPDSGLPDDYMITGTTVVDYQILEFPNQGRQLTIRIKKPGSNEFRELYKDQYVSEYKLKKGPPSDSLWFSKEIVKEGNIYRFPGPVAPIGTQYEIRSIRLSTEHNLY